MTLKNKIDVEITLNAPSATVYATFMDAAKHAAMTGQKNVKIENKVGGYLNVKDNYLTGKFMILSPGNRIVFSCRTTEFHEGDSDSVAELVFTHRPDGCSMRLIHENLPDKSKEKYLKCWEKLYLGPMQKYFAD